MIFIAGLLTLLAAAATVQSAGNEPINPLAVQLCCDPLSDASGEECYSACMKFASKCPPKTENKTEYLANYCSEVPSSFESCLSNSANVTIKSQPTASPELFQCCNLSESNACKEECTIQLEKGPLTDDTMQAVVDVCGPPLSFTADPPDEIWECFFNFADSETATDPPTQATTATNNNNDDDECETEAPPTAKPALTITYADWPRLSCCDRANSTVCRETCYQEYSGNRIDGTWKKLNLDCIYRPDEDELAICLADVINECQLGCSGLSFCQNLNNRPTQLFRDCNSKADSIALATYNQWRNTRGINLPLLSPDVMTKDLNKCHPELWQAAACAIYTRPCHDTTHSSILCKDDCLLLMEDCIDDDNEERTPEEICEILSPHYLQDRCISIRQFTEPAPDPPMVITTPCQSNPCTNGLYCEVNHDCIGNKDKGCSSYRCIAESVTGKFPNMTIAKTDLIHVTTIPSTPKQDCGGFVRAKINGDFGQQLVDLSNEYCKPLEYCIHEGVSYEHGAMFNLSDGCNFCTCHHGKVLCTSQTCAEGNIGLGATPIVSCDCPPELFAPVCTKYSKRTLPNPCIARCLGYSFNDFTIGSCSDVSPCDDSPCPSGTRCVPHKHVCLPTDRNTTSCPQYSCETPFSCYKFTGPVCSTVNNQHDSLCKIFLTQEKIDYFGYCQTECSSGRSREVCGVNGETYRTKCHAHEDGVPVDYIGECTEMPAGLNGCEDVKCPGEQYFNRNESCKGPIPPGACCRQCGAMVQVIMDQDQLKRTQNAAKAPSINSTNILTRMRVLLDVLECRLDGYVALDGTFVFLLEPTNHTSFLNVEVCNSEAVRISALINNQSPILTTDPYLHFLVAATPTFATKQTVTISTLIPNSYYAEASGCGQLMPLSLLNFIVILVCSVILYQVN